MIVCSGTFGAIPFADKARAAAAAGFEAISIYFREYEPGTRRLLDDLGLGVTEVDGPMSWLPEQPGTDPHAVLDVAAELGARAVTVLDITGQLHPGAVEHYAALCELAAPTGVTMQIEPFPWSGIASLRAAAAIVEAVNHPQAGVLLDIWHLLRGPDRGVLTHPDTVVAVQVNDVLTTAMENVRDEAMHHRQMPGREARRIIDALRAAGNNAPLELEVFNDELHALTAAEIATRAATALRSLA